MQNELKELFIAIKNDDIDSIKTLVAKNTPFSYGEIFEFTQLFFDINIPNCDILLSGQGGSKITKPNITSILALYLTLAGFDVLKISSKAMTNLVGASDFFNKINMINDAFKIKNNIFYCFDIKKTQKYLIYYDILKKNKSFFDFLKKCSYSSVDCKYKFCFRKDLKNCKISQKQIEFMHIENKYSITSENHGLFIDEIGSGKIYVNNEEFIELNQIYFPTLNKNDIEKINNSLLMGETEFPFWVEYLKNSFCIIYMIIKNVDFEYGKDIFYKLYNSKELSKYLKTNKERTSN